MKKILWIVLIVIVALILVSGIVGFFYLGPIVKVGIQRFGPQITKVAVTVDSVGISLLSGSASIKGLAVGNPQGYSAAQAISVGNMAVSLDPFSVTSNKILVHSVRVESPMITFEEGLGGNNLSKILNNMKGASQNPNTPGNTPTNANGKPASKIEIDDFLITGAKVDVSISGVGSKELPLPDIHLTDLGKGSGGLTPVELSKDIFEAIVTDTVQAVAKTVGSISGGVGNVVSNIAGSLGGLLGK